MKGRTEKLTVSNSTALCADTHEVVQVSKYILYQTATNKIRKYKRDKPSKALDAKMKCKKNMKFVSPDVHKIVFVL